MKKFIPAEKMSKKARAALARQQRTVWPCCPVGRKLESKKTYNRKRISHARFDGDGMGFFVCHTRPGIASFGAAWKSTVKKLAYLSAVR